MKKIIITVIIIAVIAVAASSYFKSIEPKADTLFVIGNTNNGKQIHFNILEAELETGFKNKSTYSVIVADGNPNEISQKDKLTLPLRFTESKNVRKRLFNEKFDAIRYSKPNDEEIDILSAINYAAKAIDKKSDIKKIVVYSSGISTTGNLNFAENPDMLYEEPSQIVELLKQRKAIPDLSNIEIVWYGLNHVDGEQEELGTFELYKLKCIWAEILKASNVKFEKLDEIFNEQPPEEIPADEIIDKSEFPKVSAANFCNITFSIEDFNFVENTAELKDREKTIEILTPIAKDIINSGCPDFYVVGSTASFGTKENCLDLSEKRANVIKDLLCSLNVPKSCLNARGIGRENIDDNYFWRVNDLYSNGNLKNSEAVKNRKVMLIPVESKTGERFKKDYDNYFDN